MKVTFNMIDKQLRMRGRFLKLINSNGENKYLKSALRNKKVLERLLKGKKRDDLQCLETYIPGKEAESRIRVRIYKPLQPKENVPGVLWIHGGGYSGGIPEMSIARYKKLIDETGCVIIAPEYRLSIEKPYPAALEDCYAALLWMKEHAEEQGFRADQLFVGGESAGGGLAAALSFYARDLDEVKIAFQMPLYPMIDDRMTGESAKDNNAPAWNSDSNKWAWKLYLSGLNGQEVPPYAAPARAEDYRNLPPTVTFVGDLEPFRDETIEFVNNLRKAGVPVEFKLFKGCYHAFDMMCPKADISREASTFFMNAFKFAVINYFAKN